MIEINQISDQVTIVSFLDSVKKLNVIIADKVKTEFNTLVDNGCSNLIVDLSNIIFIDSSGFGALVTVFNHAKNVGSRLLLSGISKETMELVKVTKLDQVFDIYPDLEVAQNSVI